MHAEVGGHVDALAQLLVFAGLLELGDIGLARLRQDLFHVFLVQGRDEGAARGGGHEPVLDHGHLRVAGVTLQVVGDQVGAAALLLLQQPVQRLGEDGAGVQPDAAVAVQQFQAQPVRALGHGQLLSITTKSLTTASHLATQWSTRSVEWVDSIH